MRPTEDGKSPNRWKPWELLKIWAPKVDAEGKLFKPENIVSRQQIRRMQLTEAFDWMKKHFPGELRAHRRRLAKARLKNFRKTEKALALQVKK
jgi:hypothetical protein